MLEFRISIGNCGMISATKYERPRAALTAEGTTPERLLLMCPKYTCAACGAPFTSYNPNPKFCSRKCKAEAQSIPVDCVRLRALYTAGFTQEEIGEFLGVSQKVIYSTMKRHGITARIAAKRDQWGHKNHMWKGDNASYAAFHYRLWKRHDGPKVCQLCGDESPDTWYDWANLTGRYEDLNDYLLMCRSCHRRYDAARRKEVMPNDAA